MRLHWILRQCSPFRYRAFMWLRYLVFSDWRQTRLCSALLTDSDRHLVEIAFLQYLSSPLKWGLLQCCFTLLLRHPLRPCQEIVSRETPCSYVSVFIITVLDLVFALQIICKNVRSSSHLYSPTPPISGCHEILLHPEDMIFRNG